MAMEKTAYALSQRNKHRGDGVAGEFGHRASTSMDRSYVRVYDRIDLMVFSLFDPPDVVQMPFPPRKFFDS